MWSQKWPENNKDPQDSAQHHLFPIADKNWGPERVSLVRGTGLLQVHKKDMKRCPSLTPKPKGAWELSDASKWATAPLVEGHTAPSGRAGTKNVLLGFQFFIPHTTIIGVSIPKASLTHFRNKDGYVIPGVEFFTRRFDFCLISVINKAVSMHFLILQDVWENFWAMILAKGENFPQLFTFRHLILFLDAFYSWPKS